MTTATVRWDAESTPFGLTRGFRRFTVGVAVVQGVHVFEHVLQLLQIHVWHTHNTMGLLGYVLQLQGTAEWLHLVFNLTYLASLVVLAIGWRQQVRQGLLDGRAYATFLVIGLALETWHSVEHAVIVRNILRNDGCPCPGILDPVLGVMDAQLHFGYNAVAYVGTLIPVVSLACARRGR